MRARTQKKTNRKRQQKMRQQAYTSLNELVLRANSGRKCFGMLQVIQAGNWSNLCRQACNPLGGPTFWSSLPYHTQRTNSVPGEPTPYLENHPISPIRSTLADQVHFGRSSPLWPIKVTWLKSTWPSDVATSSGDARLSHRIDFTSGLLQHPGPLDDVHGYAQANSSIYIYTALSIFIGK